MYTAPLQTPTIRELIHIPRYAAWLRNEKLDDFSRYQLELAKVHKLPLLQILSTSTEESLIRIFTESSVELLDHLSRNEAEAYISMLVSRIKQNRLKYIEREFITAEDVHLAFHIRKIAFTFFISGFTDQSVEILQLVQEMDLFCLHAEKTLQATLFERSKENSQESSHFIRKVNETIPGAIYVFDMDCFKGIFSNGKLKDIIDFRQEHPKDHHDVIRELVHPADQSYVKQKLAEVKLASDSDIISYKYRVRSKNGEYRWVRTFESVFKRNENGEVLETIGIVLDVDKEHRAAEALKENENLYKRAEAITHIGSYDWNLKTNQLKWSDELYRIYELVPGAEISFEMIGNMNHPEDTPRVRSIYKKAIEEKQPVDFNYRILVKSGKEKILHAMGEMIVDDQGIVTHMIGTVQDVTEKQRLVRKLEHSESVHRQAEELSNMGSWTWDLKTNKTEWSEQMYNIYEINETVESDVFKDFVHPEDKAKAEAILQELLKEKFSDHSFRIITKTGKIKKLHTIARVHTDQNGQPEYIVGAEQDVTEKENLIERLKESEQLYKQAEELANMGNWSWDIRTDKVEWTDQLYRIYGIEPGSIKVDYQKFMEMVHPADRQLAGLKPESFDHKDLVDYSFRIIRRDGAVRILRTIAQAQRDASNKVIRIVGAERDITEKQTLIDRLRKSENLYKQAQLLTHVGNWSWDVASGKVEWSDELFRIYGLAPQSLELDFETFISFVYSEDRERVKAQVEEAYRTGQSWEFIHRILRPNGEVRILSASGEVLKNENGKVSMMIGTAQDVTEKQSLIEKLQENERFFKQAQSLARMGSWTMDVKTREFSWSDEMYNIFEVSKDEQFDFFRWLTHIPEEEREDVLSYYEECLREKKNYDKTHQIILTNGKVKTVHRKGEFIYNAIGEPVKMFGTTQDITEEHRIQQELKENQTFIRKITDATPSIIASYNINTGEYVFISEGLEKLLGYETKEVQEKGVSFFASLMHPDDMGPVMEKNAQVLKEANEDPGKNDLVAEFTYRMRHANGQYRWIHTYGTVFDRNREGKVEHILNISLDITEQISATQIIKDQEHFIQQIADASPTILYLYDAKQQGIVYINREIFFVLGYAPEEIIEMKSTVTSELYHPEDLHLLPARKESMKNFQQVDSMIQYECRMKNKQGEWRWLLVREIVFKTDEEGNILQILGAALDINKRKEMEKTILQNTLLLEQSNASLEEFAYVASHDLKEPLRKISTFGDRLVASQGDHLTPEGKIYLNKIIDASNRMQNMINDLLSISMITNNTSFETYSLQKILEETLQTLEFKIEQQNATVEADELPEAFIIPFQMRQLFQNLLSNSLKFTRPGIQPLIRIRCQRVKTDDLVHYGLARAEKYHQIVLEDNGIGFDNEYAAKIFAIFQRLHGRSEYEGSGIGLAICKKIVEHHGGVIYAQGNEGQGARFTIILPA